MTGTPKFSKREILWDLILLTPVIIIALIWKFSEYTGLTFDYRFFYRAVSTWVISSQLCSIVTRYLANKSDNTN